jgi:predicted amidohydrolase
LRAAAVQLNGTEDREHNRAAADALVREAHERGAKLVVLPEKWNLIGSAAAMTAGAEPLDGETLTWAGALAAELGIDLVAGSVVEALQGSKPANTSVHLGPDGTARAVYRKLHLFDADVAGVSYRESDHEEAGDEIVTTTLADGTVAGLSVCYDVRFPELYRELAIAGARVVAIPAAFTVPTTRDHWEVLLRARAIENGVFVVAANQVGEHGDGKASGGHSAIVDPWGQVLAVGSDDGEEVILADLDFEAQDEVRARMPLLSHRRPDIYARGGKVGA